ncbi:TonB-dependent receptor [Rhabdobacter roseus]|uniref:TonB-linked SusC/RagA family outer membrane protein n=1 Tax=Rhabdobacter roseus TaxID=1655419 RepID=A0A840U013_9BACT|nr:TonB-dependent receptor [Rhabdobacter roseus]MBB5287232.1 TonB-linked SusC/RagA family outer membrane protein [Rhabdobacter roseus]
MNYTFIKKARFAWFAVLLGVGWLMGGEARAQQTVTGKVVDDTGQALPGVNVVEKGTTTGTTTNAEGDFTIQVGSANAVLTFSFVGYTPKEEPVGNRQRIDITLAPDNRQLSEVVVVGYGTQQKRDVTGAVASVSSRDIERIPVSGLDRALQGQVPGLQISSTSGAPGGNTNILIRGIGSVSGGVEPLFIVDGFPINNSGVGNPLNTINPGDIESIEVLKDASATAIYGSRGSNGVIMITTKRGKSGQSRITLDAYAGIQQVSKRLDLMNARQFAEYVIDGRNNGWLDNGGPNASINDPNSVRGASFRIPPAWQDLDNLPPYDTDWQDVIFRTAPIQNYQLTATGGNEKLRYALSGGYFNQQGILISSGFERYSARLNLDGQLTKKLKVSMNLAPTYTATDNVPSSGHYGNPDMNIINASWTMPPMIPLYNPDGSYGNTFDLGGDHVTVQNPLKIANERQDFDSQFRMIGNAFGEYELLTGLKLKVSVGADFNYFKSNIFNPSTLSATLPTAPAFASARITEDINWLNENTLSYQKTMGDHFLDAVAGFTVQKSSTVAHQTNATNFPDDLVENINGGQITGGSYAIGEWSLLSYLARVNYSFKDKYLVTGTIRTDGSSRFGSANRWGVFPSFSLGWRLSEEDFVKNLRLFDDLKIRASYGLSGNNAIGNYRSVGLLSATNYVLGNQQVPGLSQSTFTNDNLGWETSKQYDIGLDFALFNNRLQFTGDYYNRRNTDMLLNVAIPAVTGYTSAWVNLGELENRGVELALTGNVIAARDFRWTSSFNITFNKNKVLSLGESDEIFSNAGGRGNVSISRVGHPIGSFYGHVYEGIFMSQAEIDAHATQNGAKLGDIKYRDVDGNGIINDIDRDLIGNPQPKFFYGFNNTFSYKNWSLDVLLNGTQGNDVFWAGAVFAYGFHGVQNSLASIHENRYRSPEQPGNGQMPRAIRGGLNNNLRYSSFFNFDGSFLRVRNVTLNYTLPQSVAEKLGLTAGRIYGTGSNLFTFTKYPGYDPELSNSGDNVLGAGVDYAGYPVARTITIGVSLTF